MSDGISDDDTDNDGNVEELERDLQDINISNIYESISTNTPKSKSNESPSAVHYEPTEPNPVIFQIHDYQLNEEGIPIVLNAAEKEAQHNVENNKIGEILNENQEENKNLNQIEIIEDAEPDPINYDENHWKQYDPNSNMIGCRLRIFQCFSFLSCLLSAVALLTDNLTIITGPYQYGHYNDSIICGWNAIHMVQYDASIGITQSTIKYNDETVCNQNSDNHSICRNLMIHGLIWLLLSIIAIIIIFIILLLFCCVCIETARFENHKTLSGLFIVLNILFQVIAVIVWVSNDYCYDENFIRTFYDKHIESVTNGTSIDIVIGSMLCALICSCLIVCIHLQK